MNSIFAHAAVAVACNAASESRRFQIDLAAQQDPDCIIEVGLVVEAYTGRLDGLDWEGTYVWNAEDQTWGNPYILAATPEDVYDPIHTPAIIPDEVRRALDAIIEPLKKALEFTAEDKMVLDTVVEASSRGTLSPLSIEIIRTAIENKSVLAPEIAPTAEQPLSKAPIPAFGSFG